MYFKVLQILVFASKIKKRSITKTYMENLSSLQEIVCNLIHHMFVTVLPQCKMDPLTNQNCLSQISTWKENQSYQ